MMQRYLEAFNTSFALRAFAVLLFLVSLAHAQPQTQTFCSFNIDWLAYSVLALIIGIFLYSLIYMVGSLLSRPQLHAMTKTGISDIAALAVVVIIALMINEALCYATPSSLGIDFSGLKNLAHFRKIGADPNDTPMIKLGEAYLRILYYEGEKLYKSMFVQLLYAGSITSVKVGAGSTMGAIQPFAGFEPILNFAPALLSSATILLISVSAQFYLLKFIEITGLSLFFPLGILLRAIPATRSMGGALIALVFSMYFVYPLILSYNFYVLANVIKPDEGLLNSFLYNSPKCAADLECNSNKCIVDGGAGYCQPCILTGDIPDGADSSVCCSKVSVAIDGQCKIKEGIDPEDPNQFGKGGIIAKGTTTPDYGLTMFIGVSTTLAVAGKFIAPLLGKIPGKFGGIARAISGSFVLLFTVGSVIFFNQFTSFILNPIITFLVMIMMNLDFFFVGMILPIVEFITIIEFTRTLTASMGEPIDLIQVIRVI